MNDDARFQDLYRHHADALHRFVYWLSGDSDLAQDIVSETFTRIWTGKKPIRMETARGYLLAIARNLFLHHHRNQRRHTSLSEHHEPIHVPESGIEARSELAELLKAVRRLPEGERTALLLRGQEGLSYAEVARIMGKSEAAVRVLVHRARRKLSTVTTTKENTPNGNHP